MQGSKMLLLVFSCVFASWYPMRTVPLEIQGFFYGYDSCNSISPDFLDMTSTVLDAHEVVTVRKCTVATTPNGNQVMRGMNQQRMANLCRRDAPATWTYTDVDTAPLSMPYPMVSGNDTSNFLVTLSDGTTHNPVCVAMVPANEDNEMKTINIFAENLGDGQGYTTHPTKIEIVGDVFFNVNGKLVNGKGLTFTQQDDAFDFMKYTSTLRALEAKAVKFHARGDGNENDCHSADFTTATKVIRIRLSGGGTRNGIGEMGKNDKTTFVLRDASGNSMDTGYLGIAGLNQDGDNNFDLCLDDSFDLNALEEVEIKCTGADVLVPRKGSAFPCTAHTIKVDKSRMSDDYENACKCDFDHHLD